MSDIGGMDEFTTAAAFNHIFETPLVLISSALAETTDILEALKASLKVKGKPSTPTTAAKAKGKIGMAVSK